MMGEAPRPREDKSLGELLSDLTREITDLVRQEAALAKAEMSQKFSRVGRDLGFLAAGGAVAYAGLLALVAALIIGLAKVMPDWLAALLVGVVVSGIGAYLVMQGLNNLKKEDLVPRQTIESLKEDAHGTSVRNRAASS